MPTSLRVSAPRTHSRVGRSLIGRTYVGGLSGLWLVAVLMAPFPALAASALVAIVLPLTGRMALVPLLRRPRALSVDRTGRVDLVLAESGRVERWVLVSWSNHVFGLVLRLRAAGRHAAVVLPRDAMPREGARRLRVALLQWRPTMQDQG